MITDPALALQTLVRETLIQNAALMGFVSANNIRAGAIRPERMPSVILSSPRTEYLGVAAGSQRVARVFLTLNIWAQEDAQDTARQIGASVWQALEFGPNTSADIQIDEWNKPSVVWVRDPQPEVSNTQGIMLLEAVVRWRVS